VYVALALLLLAARAPLEGPTLKVHIEVEREAGGGCSALMAGRSTSHPVMIMGGVCHGWGTASCADNILFVGEPVIEAQAQVLFTVRDKSLDLVPLIDRAIARQWPGHGHLHLNFGKATCDGQTLVAPFAGSELASGKDGPAQGMVGSVRITSPSDYRVTVQHAP
jgi:hypothetical protein